MALNVTTAVIGSGCNTATATPSLAQWDVGQVLKIEGGWAQVEYMGYKGWVHKQYISP